MKQAPASNETLDKLQRDAFDYFLKETNPANGLVADTISVYLCQEILYVECNSTVSVKSIVQRSEDVQRMERETCR
jgi:hypothetical protein